MAVRQIELTSVQQRVRLAQIVDFDVDRDPPAIARLQVLDEQRLTLLPSSCVIVS
jgi:hypothetical protein